MKKIIIVALSVVLTVSLLGCEPSEQQKTEASVQKTVAKQDTIYNKTEPIPTFNYSLPRHLWIQFYKVTTTKVVRTWSVPVTDYGTPLEEVQPTIGYPIPMDTQLTNPEKLTRNYGVGGDGGGYIEGSLPQSEPNGLYTSPNTNATIYFTVGEDGSIAPCYSEHKVQCWPYPMKWDADKKIFVRTGGESSIKLDTKGAESTK